MTVQHAASRTLPSIFALVLLGCGAGAPGASVSVTIERTEPYTETLPAAEGVPDRFSVDGPRSGAGKCDLRLVDPQGAAELRLVTATMKTQRATRGDTTVVVHSGYGDYVVDPASAYGLAAGERLRVDCGGNVPVGRVAAEP